MEWGFGEVAEILLNHEQIHFNAKDHDGNTPYRYARGRKESDNFHVKLLISHKDIDVNDQTLSGWRPLHQASICGWLSIAKDLLARGADPNATIPAGAGGAGAEESALHLAAYAGLPDLVKELIANGADPNYRNWLEETPLMSIAFDDKLSTAQTLITMGADVNVATFTDGDTALTLAAKKGQCKVVKLLLENGADFNHVTYKGKTALYLAKYFGRKSVVKELKFYAHPEKTKCSVM